MTHGAFRTQIWAPARLEQLLLTSALAPVLTTLPVSINADGPPLGWQTAFAKDGAGGGGGNGGGNGNGGGQGGGHGDHGRGPDHGPGGQGHAYGLDEDHGGQAGGANGYHDFNEFADSVRSGKAVGLERHDERIDQARGRYAAALGNANQVKQAPYGPNAQDGIGPAAHRFSPEETQALMERGWKGPTTGAAGFRNHGERVRTMVALSKRLGYGARVGALQANFGSRRRMALRVPGRACGGAGGRQSGRGRSPPAEMQRRSRTPSRARDRMTPGRPPTWTPPPMASSTSATSRRSTRAGPALVRTTTRRQAEHARKVNSRCFLGS